MKDFLAQLRKEQVYLSLVDGELSVKYVAQELDQDLLAQIKTRKGDLISYLSSQHKRSYSSISPVPEADSYVLSSAQKRLWVLGQFDDSNSAYNITTVCTLEGPLNRPAFEEAFLTMIGRHEILRTVFGLDAAGDVRQFVKPVKAVGFTVQYQDLREAQAPAAVVDQLVSQDMEHAFSLTEGPLLSVRLLRVAPEKYVLVYVIHHIISDGWSAGIMLRELLTIYNATVAGRPHRLPPLRLQYKDYATWQQHQLSDERLTAHKGYWLEQFAGEVPMLEMPADHGRPSRRTYHGAVVTRQIPVARLRAFKALLQQEQATLFMGLLAAFKGVLYRYTGQEDIVIGSPVAGRDHMDLEDQLGFYVNMLPMRTRFSGRDSFRELLQAVKNVTIGAFEHQVYPFDELVHALQLQGDLSRHPLFDVVLVLQNTDGGGQETKPEHLRVLPYQSAERVVSLFDIRLDLQEAPDGLHVLLEYNCDIYEQDRMERLIGHFGHLIDAATTRPDLSLCRLDYLSPWEKLLPADEVDYPRQLNMVDLFEAQVARHPDRVAVVSGEETTSYRELNERANRISQFLLREMALAPEECVGLLLDRNTDCIAAILGVLKAGGVYVPMEMDTPEERFQFMLRDAGCRVLLVDKGLLETANRLQWSVDGLEAYLCPNSTSVYEERESRENVMMSQELWDQVGEQATDQITGGGWSSSFTGDPIPAEEMEEYAMNVFQKLAPYLHPGLRVLEIGCSSGLTLNKVAPHVGFYCGTDLSAVILENTGKMVQEKGWKHVKLANLVAHQLSDLGEKDFDLVIVNSVIQHFHGHNYLRAVIRDAVSLLKENGRIFIGDVMDANRKDQLLRDLHEYKALHKHEGHVTKTDFSADLFVARGYFEDLAAHGLGIREVTISDKIRTLENELTRYRYDALLVVDKNAPSLPGGSTHKRQFDRCALTKQPADNPGRRIDSANLAYLIYTSGTTGLPKGVQVQHYNVVRLFFNDKPRFDFSADDVWTMFHSYCFDFSVWEMYGALFYGGKLVLVPKPVAQDAAAYLALLAEEGVTVLNQTPSAFYSLSAELASGPAPRLSLRYVIFGGEALSPGKLKSWHQAYPEVKLVNMYGITETTVHVTYKGVTAAEIASNCCNIGQAIPTLYCYVLDEQLQRVPVGVPGELFVGGAGVARGYLNREKLTAQRFLPNPFRPGDVLYRSGDKVRLLSNGDLEYLGRLDHQVKIRGYRVELGDIEAVLLRHGQISEVLVTAAEEKSGHKFLVAYLVGKESLSTRELREYVGERLPEYMVPAHFVQLDKFPLTGNGKINRKMLPNPLQAGLAEGEGYEAPADDTEAMLASLWEHILDRMPVGRNDDFFALGGHSLKAMQLKSSIHKEMQVQVELRDVFTHTCLVDLAAFIRAQKQRTYVVIPKAAGQESYPMSNAQLRFWMLSQFRERASAYNMTSVFLLRGELHLAAMQKALHFVISRHESLRTVFKENEAHEVRQYILPAQDYQSLIEYTDTSSQADQEERLREMHRSEQLTVFDLTRGPLLRVKVARLAGDLHAFMYTMPHIITDGWSMEIFTREMVKAYNAFRQNGLPALPTLRIQYKDYAAWQAELRNSTSVQEHEAYWQRQFAHETPLLELFTGAVRPAVPAYRGSSAAWALPDEPVQGLKKLCSANGATLFMGLLAGLKALFFRYTGEGDITVGTPLAGRDHKDLEGQIGAFLNTIALRTRFSGADSFARLLNKEKEVLLEAYKHQDYPADLFAGKSQSKRDLGMPQLFNVWVVLQNQHTTRIGQPSEGFDGLLVSSLAETETVTSQFDLLFDFQEDGQALQLQVSYNTDLYSRENVTRLYDHFLELLTAVTTHADKPLREISYLPAPERHRLLREFNDTGTLFPSHASVVALFERQAAEKPQQVALVHQHWRTTYGALNAQSNRLAHHLREQHGVGPGTVVGICLDRCPEMIAALLAVLKAGAAYLPLDPDHPAGRLGYMLSDAGAGVVLTQADKVLALGEAYSGEMMALDVELDGLPDRSHNPDVPSRPDHLAYVIYTSGSTGTPKGCMITHANLSNYIGWAAGYYLPPTGGGNWALCTSLAFDLTVTSIFTPLTTGKQLYIGSNAGIADLLQECFSHPEVDTIKLTPSHLTLLEGLALTETPVKTIICGGEQLTHEQMAGVWKINREIRIFNEYGPTETTVGCTAKRIGPEDETVLIGKPIANTQIYILDEGLQPCGTDVCGEIYVGGAGVGAGYLNQAALTQEKFPPNPFRPGERMYRTGDTGKWLPSGEIACLGRTNDQVKIRGYRIEPGEIESVLRLYPGVTGAVVALKPETGTGSACLVAYLVAGPRLDLAAVRDYLGRQLPAFMIPQYLIQVAQIPLTLNGKTDREALPAPAPAGRLADQPYAPPGNREEAQMAEVWAQVLGVEKVGIYDDFFALGGYSIKALELVAALRTKMDLSIALADIFRYPTIHKLSQAGLLPAWAPAQIQLLGGTYAKDKKLLFFVPPSSGISYWYMGIARAMQAHANVYLMSLRGIFDEEPLYTDIDQVIEGFTAHVRNHPTGKEPVYLAGYSSGGPVIVEMAKKLEAEGRRVVLFILDAVPKKIYHEPVGDKETFVKTFFPNLESTRQLGRSINAAEDAWQKYVEVAYAFHRLWPDYEASPGSVKADTHVFVNDEQSDLAPYEEWQKHVEGNLTFTFLTGGPHTEILQKPSNTSIMQKKMVEIISE